MQEIVVLVVISLMLLCVFVWIYTIRRHNREIIRTYWDKDEDVRLKLLAIAHGFKGTQYVDRAQNALAALDRMRSHVKEMGRWSWRYHHEEARWERMHAEYELVTAVRILESIMKDMQRKIAA